MFTTKICRVVAPKETTQLVDKFELAIAYKMFMSPYLEKRLMGLSDIKRYVDLVLRKEDYQQRMRQTDRAPQGNLPAAINVWIDSKYVFRFFFLTSNNNNNNNNASYCWGPRTVSDSLVCRVPCDSPGKWWSG